MGLNSLVSQIWLDREQVAWRASQVYTVAVGTYALFNIVSGPVEITALGGIVRAAAVGATELRLSVNGVNVDAAAVAVNGAVGTVVVSCVNVAGTLINAAALPRTVATKTTMISGVQAAAVGVIQAIFTVGTSWTGEFFVVYRKLSPTAQIVRA